MKWIALAQLIGFGLACWAAKKVDDYDDLHGIRPGASVDGYGSNRSFVWPYTPLAWIGFLAALLAPVTLIVGSQ